MSNHIYKRNELVYLLVYSQEILFLKVLFSDTVEALKTALYLPGVSKTKTYDLRPET